MAHTRVGASFVRLSVVLILLALPIAVRAHTNNINWINRLSLDLLGRLATAAEQSSFDGLLDGGTSRQAAAQMVVAAGEFDTLTVQEAYGRFLNRAAAPGDLSFFVASLSSSLTDQAFFATLVASAEYFANSGGTNAGFIQAAYQDLLGRNPSASDASFWLAQLAGALPRTTLASALLANVEARNRVVDAMFATYLRRPPTGTELSAFSSQLMSLSYDQLRAAILGSGDYFTLAQSLPLVATGCPMTPAPGCFAAVKSSLSINLLKNTFAWQWSKGTVDLQQSDFGDPLNGTTSYKLCVYDQTGATSIFRMGVNVAPGNTCGTKPCWKAVKELGWSYKSKDGNGDGITKVAVKAGLAGKSKLVVQGKGASLPNPTATSSAEVFDQDTAVTVQLHASSPTRCWSSTFDATSTKKNDGEQFKAKTP